MKLKKPHEITDMSRVVYLYNRQELTPSEVQKICTKSIKEYTSQIIEIILQMESKDGVPYQDIHYNRGLRDIISKLTKNLI